MKKRLFLFFAAVLLVGLPGCGNSNDSAEKSLRSILEVHGDYSEWDKDSIIIESSIEIDSQIKGLNGEHNKFILISGNSNNQKRYSYFIADLEDKEITRLLSQYTPFYFIVDYILEDESKETNVSNFNKIAEYINEYGVDCFLVQENAEEYVREITGVDGIISTVLARGVINDARAEFFTNVAADEIAVLFEPGNSNPAYFAMQTGERVYNWGWTYPEEFYSTLDADTRAALEYSLGPAYTQRTVWVAIDKNGNTVGASSEFLDEIREWLGVE